MKQSTAIFVFHLSHIYLCFQLLLATCTAIGSEHHVASLTGTVTPTTSLNDENYYNQRDIYDPIPETGLSRERTIYERTVIQLAYKQYEDFLSKTNYDTVLQDLGHKVERNFAVSVDKLTQYADYNLQKLSSSPRANRKLCDRHLTEIVNRLKYQKSTNTPMLRIDPILATLLDSFGKPSGMLIVGGGYVGAVGDYARCSQKLYIDLTRDVNDKNSNQKQIVKTQYCVTNLRLQGWSNSSHSKLYNRVKFAICIPDSCDTSSANEYIDKVEYIAKSNMVDLYKDFYVDSVFCSPHPESELRNWRNNPSTVRFVTFLTIWLSFTALATFLNNYLPKRDNTLTYNSTWRTLVDVFDWKKNASRLWTVKEEKIIENEKETSLNRPIKFVFLDGAKVIASVSIISGHMMMGMSFFQRDFIQGEVLLHRTLALGSLLPSLAVNSFYVITGLLTSYLLLKKSVKTLTNPIFWSAFIGVRYVRIIPLKALAVGFMKYGFKYISDGPFWDHGVSLNSHQYFCEHDDWSTVFLVRSATRSPTSNCIWPNWYLANDIIFSILTPFVMIPFLIGNKTAATTTLVILSAIGIDAARQLNKESFYYETLLAADGESATTFFNELGPYYTSFAYRFVPYLIGIYAGFKLDEYSTGNFNLPESFWKHISTFNKLAFSAAVLSPILTRRLTPTKTLAILQIIILLVLSSIWSATFILTIVTGRNETMRKILETKVWTRLARLALSVLLVHNIVIFYYFESMPAPLTISFRSYFESLPVVLFLTYFFSFLFCSVFESPIKNLCSHIINMLLASQFVKDRPSESNDEKLAKTCSEKLNENGNFMEEEKSEK